MSHDVGYAHQEARPRERPELAPGEPVCRQRVGPSVHLAADDHVRPQQLLRIPLWVCVPRERGGGGTRARPVHQQSGMFIAAILPAHGGAHDPAALAQRVCSPLWPLHDGVVASTGQDVIPVVRLTGQAQARADCAGDEGIARRFMNTADQLM